MRTGDSVDERCNQTEEHRKLVELAYMWTAERAYRGVRATTEFAPSGGYSADLLAIMSPFGKVHNERYIPKEKWYKHNSVLVFEAKASRTDFLRHFGPKATNERTEKPMGHLHWIVITDGLVDKSEVPGWWGLLEQRGAALRELKKPTYCELPIERIHEIAHDMLWAKENWMREQECARIMKVVTAMKERGIIQVE